ncbi:MAG: dihydroneopterin aldolase [Burkholderiaceae bacterium]|nr:dihydroneopterin aldolase [Burkholderiaceae bacterium]
MSALLDPRLAGCRRIYLSDFAIDASIGFHDFELAARQRVLINVDLFVPIEQSTSASDHVGDVVDYDFLRHRIVEIADEKHYNLQETLLDRIVDACFEQAGVRAVRASTEKPHVYPDCRTVGIEVFRFRP